MIQWVHYQRDLVQVQVRQAAPPHVLRLLRELHAEEVELHQNVTEQVSRQEEKNSRNHVSDG